MEWIAPVLKSISAENVVIGALLVIIGMQTKIIMVFVNRFFTQQDRMMDKLMVVEEHLETVKTVVAK